MATPSFVHLHCHTEYSLLDGANRIDALVKRAREFGSPAVAITDHGNMFGAIEFYLAAKKAGIKPIIGCEVYLAPGDRRSKDAKGMKEASYHLLLLARNLTGYRNLLKLVSLAYREGFYYRPRIDKEVLAEFNEGLLCTSTCLGGEIPQALMTHNRARAEDLAKTYLSIFGPDRFFIELQNHGLPEQKQTNPELAEIAQRLGVATIATNDAHYLEAADAESHDVLCCISTGKLQKDEDRFKFPNGEFYLKSPQQMAELFVDYPDALANTLRVADLCNVEFEFGKRYAPVYKLEDTSGKEDSAAAAARRLRELVYDGASKRYGELSPEIRERIDYELQVISSKGFSSYFLIVWDFVNYARSEGIPCGARGSACSSVVAYCLGISAPDPLRYGLYFERFMDPDRDEMPDIDVDICQVGRADVIDYVRRKYGHVAQIITFNRLKAKAAVKDVARVMGIGFEEANNLTKLIPSDLNMTIDRALEQEPELKRQYDEQPNVRHVIDVAKRLEGVARNAGIHAAGVVIADVPLDTLLPLYKPPGEEQIVTQFDGPMVEKVGLLKMDFLGLRTLTTLERARLLVREGTGEDIDLDKINFTDPKVFDLFTRGETIGIFQFESGGMRDVVMRMRPNRIEDLIAANALYRPGPMRYIDLYISRKHGEKWDTPHAIMTEVLNETYGIMVYQEQVSRLVNRLGGIELKRAFRLAKAISKKKKDMIDAERGPFLDGCVRNGVARETGQKIFDDILEFGGYAFNKAHSTGYALVAYQTAWMKVYHPVEFMAALMTFEMHDTAKIMEYIDACRQMGIAVLPPDINASVSDFTVDRTTHKQAIRFGLTAIKGVGEKAVNSLVSERKQGGAFKNLFDFCERVDSGIIGKSTAESFINCGAFDSTGSMRKALTLALERAWQAGSTAQRDRRMGQMGLFGGGNGNGHGDKVDEAPHIGSEEWSESEMLAREKAALGFYITRHPLTARAALLEACSTTSTADLARFEDGTSIVLGGMVSSLRTVVTKAGRNPGSKLGIVTLEDLKGKTEAILFPDNLEKYRSLVKPDEIIFIKGSVDRRREEPSVRASEVIPAAAAVAEFCQFVILSLAFSHSMLSAGESGGIEKVLNQLLELVRRYPGPRSLFLDLPGPDGRIVTIRCAPELAVNPTPEFLTAAAAILGPAGVILRAPGNKAIPW